MCVRMLQASALPPPTPAPVRERERESQRDISACVRRHQAFALRVASPRGGLLEPRHRQSAPAAVAVALTLRLVYASWLESLREKGVLARRDAAELKLGVGSGIDDMVPNPLAAICFTTSAPSASTSANAPGQACIACHVNHRTLNPRLLS